MSNDLITTIPNLATLAHWAVWLVLATIAVALLGAFLRALGWLLQYVIPIAMVVLLVFGIVWVAREQIAGERAVERQVWQQTQDPSPVPQDAPPEPDRPSPMPEDPAPPVPVEAPPVEAQP